MWQPVFAQLCTQWTWPTSRPNHNETTKLYRKMSYLTLHTMATATMPTRSLRIETRHPNHNWPQIWPTLHDAQIPEAKGSTWYTAVHDIMPTKQRLCRIAHTNTNRCAKWGHIDKQLTAWRNVAQENIYGPGHRIAWQTCSTQAHNTSLSNEHSAPNLARDPCRDTEQSSGN
jgi:hypothetical protein